MATSGEYLRIWEVGEQSKNVKLVSKLFNVSFLSVYITLEQAQWVLCSNNEFWLELKGFEYDWDIKYWYNLHNMGYWKGSSSNIAYSAW